jgi:hypothetical protein
MTQLRLAIYVSIATPRLRSFLSVKNHFLTNPSLHDGYRPARIRQELAAGARRLDC